MSLRPGTLAAFRAFSLPLLLTLSACAGLSGKQSDISYGEASDRLTSLAERSVSIGLGSESELAQRSSGQGLCDGAFGGPSDYVRPVLRYQFPLDRLDRDLDRFTTEVEELWLDSEFEKSSDLAPDVAHWFGVSEDGFNFQLTVNRVSGIIYVDASGPCVDPPDE